MEPVNDYSIIGFYNNSNIRNETKGLDTDKLSSMQESAENQIQNLLINTKFKIDSKLQSSVKIRKGQTHVSMLGQDYDCQEKFEEDFGKLIWLTYRKNFAPLLIEKNKVAHLTSDAGWGCVMRCT